MMEWTSIEHLLLTGTWTPEELVAAILDAGLQKRVAFKRSVPATDLEKHSLCSTLELFHQYVDVLDYSRAEALGMTKKSSAAAFYNYGWDSTALPRQLIVGSCAPGEGGRREVEGLGFWTPAQQARLVPEKAAPAPSWQSIAKWKAKQFIHVQAEKGLFPSQLDVAHHVAVHLREQKIYGSSGKPMSALTVKRHALQGISSAAKKTKSTTLNRGKQSKPGFC